ncbi:hypothetical protein Pla123a_35030 [Posidoniimonas polymericola]|uniref:Uncharacterized protein n=1 Tax=Posidoniimonas polymericola TaxID=2528002 RepID=A0A5C5YIJ1_9BACT|nr:hypothetical protein [Posidoniimonas polymericola]TWT74679.1 hypothetical protein Pla123a_35030 [Posidoniimonas polymericola]
MGRYRHKSAAFLSIALVFCLTAGLFAAQQGGKEPTFRERLVLGLQARRPSEVEFIDAVVDTVERGRLPRKLVDRTYFWARERSPVRNGKKSHRPIIYFQPALTIQAEKLGITIARD